MTKIRMSYLCVAWTHIYFSSEEDTYDQSFHTYTCSIHHHHDRDTGQFQQPSNLGCTLSWSTPATCTQVTTIVTSITANFYPCLIYSMYSFLSVNIILGNTPKLLNSSLSFLLICHNSADRYLDCFSFRLLISKAIIVCAELLQLCPTLCNLMDYSPMGFSVHGIFQARILEWVAISFSRGSSRPRN